MKSFAPLMLPVLSALTSLIIATSVSAQTDTLDGRARVPAHPRILLFAGEEDAIKKNIQSDKYWGIIHQTILSECDKMLDLPPVQRVLIGKRLLDKSRECLRRVFFLSYAWRMTHEEKYLKRAENELLAVSAFSDWNPGHFLDVAEMTLAVSIGYDWLYDNLSGSSRSLIKTAIIQKGIEPSLDSHNNGWLKNTNNWNQVCNTGMSYGALAVYEDNPRLALSIINRAVRSIDTSMKTAYSPDGAYPEGYGYWGYGTSFNVLLISSLEKIFGRDFGLSQKPGFLHTPYFMENMMGPSGLNFTYSDSGPGWEPQPAMAWFAKKLKDPSLLLIERGQVSLNRKNALNRERLLPAFLIWGAGIRLDQLDAPGVTMYTGGGVNPVAMMRTSWTDPNAIYIGLKAGTPKASHAHMDAGSFVMDAEGVRWALDLGMQDYESLESKGVDLWNNKQNSQRWQVFRYNNFAHNTLTVNGELQNVEGSAPMISHSATPLFMNAVTDLTSLYKGGLSAAKRGIAIFDKKYVIVKDEVTATNKETVVRWTMLTQATVSLPGGNAADLAIGDKRLRLQVAEPANVNIIARPATPLNAFDAPNPGVTIINFEIKLAPGARQDITVLLIPEMGGIQANGGQGNASPAGGKIKPLAEWPE